MARCAPRCRPRSCRACPRWRPGRCWASRSTEPSALGLGLVTIGILLGVRPAAVAPSGGAARARRGVAHDDGGEACGCWPSTPAPSRCRWPWVGTGLTAIGVWRPMWRPVAQRPRARCCPPCCTCWQIGIERYAPTRSPSAADLAPSPACAPPAPWPRACRSGRSAAASARDPRAAGGHVDAARRGCPASPQGSGRAAGDGPAGCARMDGSIRPCSGSMAVAGARWLHRRWAARRTWCCRRAVSICWRATCSRSIASACPRTAGAAAGVAAARCIRLRLAPALLADGLAVGAAEAQPLYIRDKVAQTEAERAAAQLPPMAPIGQRPDEPTPRIPAPRHAAIGRPCCLP